MFTEIVCLSVVMLKEPSFCQLSPVNDDHIANVTYPTLTSTPPFLPAYPAPVSLLCGCPPAP